MKNDSLSTLSLSFVALKKHFWVSKKSDDHIKVGQAITLIQEHSSNTNTVPYSLEVANILRGFDVDQVTLIATILSDRDLLDILPEDKLRQDFGDVTTTLVQSVRRLNQFHNCDNPQQVVPPVPKQAEGLRRMLLAITKDARAVLIKLAWRLQHLRALAHKDTNKRHCTAQETMDIFAPLANRLGISQIKWELEDLSFRYIDPVTYKYIAKALSLKRTERERYIAEFVEILKQFVSKHNIEATVYGRPKHIYSIYKKMQNKQLDSIDQLYDLRAIRVIVDNQMNCYKLLGEIHSRWQSIPDEFDDYIANKKPNGYQSLHTVVFGPKGRTIEIQIRTQDMHTFAELGVAAHWRYKEGGSQNAAMEKAISSLRELLILDDNDTGDELLGDFQAEIFPDRVFALTPKGDVIDLPKGATPLDFAYAVHTHIGHRCRGAKVNERIVPLTYQLSSGDQVEVLTHKTIQPNRNWLNSTFGYMQSSRARNAVRHWFRQQDHDINKHDGQILLDREVKRLGDIVYNRNALIKHFHKRNYHELLIALGRGDIGAHQLTNVLSPPAERKPSTAKASSPLLLKKTNTLKLKGGIKVDGIDNMLVNIANCCKPVPHDAIRGYITLGRGVSIHRTDCPNINPNNLSKDQKARLIAVSWGDTDNQTPYSLDIQVSGLDRPGLLRDVTIEIATASANIIDIDIQHEANTLMAKIAITMQIRNTEQLEIILQKLTQLPSVVDASRSN